MAVTYGFFNSVNGDRKYNADQMSEYFRGIVSQGVFQHLDSGMAVSAGTGLSVSVAAGRAIIQNRWVQNSAALNLTISDASETYGRKDAVVIRLDKSSRAISIAVKTGTPAASPVAPEMTRNETTYEMALAYVNVAAGASSVTVIDKRSDSSICGWASVAQATSGEVDQMLNDMKTGFDGVVYSSPAAMVQGEDQKLQGEIDNTNEELTGVYDEINGDPNYTVGYYFDSNGAIQSDSGHCISDKIIMSPSSQRQYYYGTYSDKIRIVFFDSSDNVLNTYIGSSGQSYRNLTAPANTSYVRFSFTKGYDARVMNGNTPHWVAVRNGGIIKSLGNIIDSFDATQEYNAGKYVKNGDNYYRINERHEANVSWDNTNKTAINSMDEVSAVTDKIWGMIPEKIAITNPTSGYLSNTGTATANNSYAYTEAIDVKENDVIMFVPKYQGTSVVIRFLAAFEGETVKSAKGVSTSTDKYIVPNGITSIRVTGYVAESGNPNTLPYLYRFRYGKFIENDNISCWRTTGSLSDGTTLTLPANSIVKNKEITFYGKITTFDSILIGRTTYQNAIKIDNTNIIVLDENGDAVQTKPHGMTISYDLGVNITRNLSNTTCSVRITSNGSKSESILITWEQYNSGSPYVKSSGSTLTECVFAYTPRDINKAIWGFGDSYFSFFDARWMGQLMNAGFDSNLLVNAFPGAGADDLIPDFESLFSIGKPKYIMWCSGMNDRSDDSTQPSYYWLNAVKLVIAYCEAKGIIPILATIPTVPTINNEQKNAWVRASGYRYIDFAKAVGADSSGNWHTGFLSEDGVHPTEAGAIALYSRAITDFPELMETS
jgi:hypothetical protein